VQVQEAASLCFSLTVDCGGGSAPLSGPQPFSAQEVSEGLSACGSMAVTVKERSALSDGSGRRSTGDSSTGTERFTSEGIRHKDAPLRVMCGWEGSSSRMMPPLRDLLAAPESKPHWILDPVFGVCRALPEPLVEKATRARSREGRRTARAAAHSISARICRRFTSADPRSSSS
jgi:hypothetical protein